jgi:branched-chain amino acid transport system permease protein
MESTIDAGKVRGAMYPIELLGYIMNGVFVGSIYAVVAVTFSLIWGIVRIVNLSHGEFVMLGAYICYWSTNLFGLNAFIGLILIFPILFIFGYSLEYSLLYTISKKSLFITLLLTYGLAIFLENVALWIWKGDVRVLMTEYSGLNIFIGGIYIPLLRLIVLIIAIAITVIFYYWLTKTKIGKAIRAARDNLEAAACMGIPIKKIYSITVGVAAAIAGILGGLIAMILPISPLMGFPITLRCFTISAFAGVGNIPVCFIGGTILGVIESLTSVFISPALKEAIVFIVLFVVLIIRPKGIAGGV